MEPIPRIRRQSRVASALRRWLGEDEGLHRCVACGSDYVCPVDWQTSGPDHWLIQLHCGECDIWREARVTNEEAKDFDLVLDRQVAQIAGALAKIDQERMSVEAEVFAAALRHDLIDATDFARS